MVPFSRELRSVIIKVDLLLFQIIIIFHRSPLLDSNTPKKFPAKSGLMIEFETREGSVSNVGPSDT